MKDLKQPAAYLNALMERNHNLAYKFPQGYVFFKVLDYEDTVKEFIEYNSVTTASSSATLGAATTAKQWWQWKTEDNIDLFRETASGYMLQCFVGIKPSTLRLYKHFPAPMLRGNLSEILVDPTPDRDTIGWIDGSDSGSPFDMPTDLTEMLVPTNFPTIEFAVFNPEGLTVQPVFKIPIRRLQVRALNPKDDVDRAIINDIVTGRRVAKVYGNGMGEYQYDMTTPYGVCPIPWQVV